MKENELMIGDWVYDKSLTYPNLPCKVHSIEGRYPRINKEFDSQPIIDVWVGDGFLSSHIENIEPIPLTAEILEKNGWEAFNGRYDIVRYRILTNEMALIIEPMKVESILGERWFWLSANKRDGAVRPNMNYPFCYVHELQHALHVCGLHEFANNFKIE